MNSPDVNLHECGVLMMGYGGPTSFDEVRPFVEGITAGRSVSPERIEAVIEQYRLIGGKSPFNDLTNAQARALEKDLTFGNQQIPVFLGTLFWKPSIKVALTQMVERNIKHVVALIMAPHRTEASFDRYVKAVNNALHELAVPDLKVEFVSAWHNHPLFIQAIAQRVKDALKARSQNLCARTCLIFTAHSVPIDMDKSSGYALQITQTSQLVAATLAHNEWMLAFQSRSGNPKQTWLEPDIGQALVSCAKSGFQRAVVIPIGFVCDHVEVLYDLDVLANSVAGNAGIEMLRVPTVGSNPIFIQLLSELVQDKLMLAHKQGLVTVA